VRAVLIPCLIPVSDTGIAAFSVAAGQAAVTRQAGRHQEEPPRQLWRCSGFSGEMDQRGGNL